MAVNNRIANIKVSDKATEYKCGEETVKLSPSIIRNFLVRGNGNVTDQEVTMFLNLCRFQHLNPFLNEAYLIKFGNQPATIVTGKDAITKRAVRNPNYKGQQAGVIVRDDKTRKLEYRIGTLIVEGETLVGGWAKVFVNGYEVPIEAAVSLNEYIGLTKDGEVNSQWAKKPGTMIRKVALVQALREAFPEDLGGMYSTEETNVEIDETTVTPIEVPPEDIIDEDGEPDPAPEQTTMDDLTDEF